MTSATRPSCVRSVVPTVSCAAPAGVVQVTHKKRGRVKALLSGSVAEREAPASSASANNVQVAAGTAQRAEATDELRGSSLPGMGCATRLEQGGGYLAIPVTPPTYRRSHERG